MQIEFDTYKRPYFGSDYTICRAAENNGSTCSIAMVLDTIGHHPISHVRRFLRNVQADMSAICKDKSHTCLADIDRAVTEQILAQNEYIWSNNPMLKSRPVGFCLALAMSYGHSLQCKWLGDCRIYHLRPPVDPDKVPQVTLLTTDHNRLRDVIETEETYTFLKNEMTELSRSLTLYWGKPEQATISTVLVEQQQATIEIQPRDCILLVTDGAFLPLVRSQLDMSHFKLTREQFTLEEALSVFLAKGQFFQPGDKADRWKDIIPGIMQSIEKYTNRKSRYKDDIAAVALHVT